MIKRIPRPVESEESKFNRQYYEWLNDSHYWIEENDGCVITCKWCGKHMPQVLNHSTLCMKNPEILKIIEGEENNIDKNLDKLDKKELIKILKELYLIIKKNNL